MDAFLDTNILVGFFKGDPLARAALERFTALKIPAAAYAEFMTGLKSQMQIDTADPAIHALFEIVHTDDEICHETAELRRRTRLKLPDAMIYATARVKGGVLITFDKDFATYGTDVFIPGEGSA